jgi:hypothetical protein
MAAVIATERLADENAAEFSLSARSRLQQSPLFGASCDELYVTAMLLFWLLVRAGISRLAVSA